MYLMVVENSTNFIDKNLFEELHITAVKLDRAVENRKATQIITAYLVKLFG